MKTVTVLKNEREKKQKRLGIDLDNVIAYVDPVVEREMRKMFGTEPDRSICNYKERFGVSSFDDYQKFWDYFVENKLWLEVEPVKGAKEALKELSKDYTICIVTGRWHYDAPQTLEWLARENIYYDELMFVALRKKTQLGVTFDVFIEDNAKVAEEFAKQSWCSLSLLYLYPWNESYTFGDDVKDKIVKVRDWGEIVKALGERGE